MRTAVTAGSYSRGVLLLILGTLNFIEGLAAIGNAHFFVHNTHYIAGSLNTWGWVVLCVGVIEWGVGLGVFFKNQFSRWAGVVILSLNAIAQLMMIPACTWWSVSIFTLDILAIYGLIRLRQEDRKPSDHTPARWVTLVTGHALPVEETTRVSRWHLAFK